MAVVSGLAHLAFLGRPERFWKMWRAKNSWIARGFIGLSLFMIGGSDDFFWAERCGMAKTIRKLLAGSNLRTIVLRR